MPPRRVTASPVDCLQLEPVARSDPWPVRAIDALGNDALDIEQRARVEQPPRMLRATNARWSWNCAPRWAILTLEKGSHQGFRSGR
jgi:hypothetical protein